MNRGLLFYSMPLLLLVAALLQSTAANRILVHGVKPDLVLLLVLIGSLIFGSRSGIFWGFWGGIALDLFSGGALGSSSLALIAASLAVGSGHRTLSRYNIIVPIAAVAVGTLVYGLVYLGLLIALEGLAAWSAQQGVVLNILRPDLSAPLWVGLARPALEDIIVPTLFYNVALMLLLAPLLNRMPESPDGV
jgi:rod shape-determining protein MreD